MRTLYSASLLTLALAVMGVTAQEDTASDKESASGPAVQPAPSTETPQSEERDRGAGATTPLREGYEPTEEISRDKAEAFPADI